MKRSAIAVANYFVHKASVEPNAQNPLTLLRLVKYVYIAYGLAMAALDEFIINETYDKVEAWKYGPVIPSVYYSFKHNQSNPIRNKASIVTHESSDGVLSFETPIIKDKNIKEVLDFVWDEYKDCSITSLIEELHDDHSPWGMYYAEGKNVVIPHKITKKYYEIRLKNASECEEEA